MGICANCQHLRRARPHSQLLAAAFTTTQAEVTQALSKVVEDEQKVRDGEADLKRAQASAGKDTWPGLPLMSDFCAFKAEAGIFYIAEVKNAGGECRSINTEARERRPCATCVHRTVPDGPARDREQEEIYAQLSSSATIAHSSTAGSDSLLDGYRKGVASRRAFELTGAYHARGRMAKRPDYLDYCAARSSEDEFVVCTLVNPWHDCPEWQLSQVSAAKGVASATANEPMKAAETAKSGSPTGTPAASAIPISEAEREPPHSVPGSQSEVLARGNPPLTKPLLAETIAALEWILDVSVPSENRPLVEANVVEEWGESGHAVTRFMPFLDLYRQAAACDVEMAIALRESAQPGVVASMRPNQDAATRLVLGLYDTANAPIARGNPPLTKKTADCYLDFSGFAQSLAEGVDWVPLDAAARSAQTNLLTIQYPHMPRQQQAWIAQLPQSWNALRVTWRGATHEQRQLMRQQILAQFGLRERPFTIPKQPEWDAFGNVRQPGALSMPAAAPEIDPLDQIIAADNARVAEQEKTNPELAREMRLNYQVKHAQMISNQLNMRHEAMKKILER